MNAVRQWMNLVKIQKLPALKGLGEISPDEFIHFIGEDIRLEPVILTKDASIDSILSYFMGKNTPERQDFIIDNLRVEKDLPETLSANTSEEAETTELAS